MAENRKSFNFVLLATVIALVAILSFMLGKGQAPSTASSTPQGVTRNLDEFERIPNPTTMEDSGWKDHIVEAQDKILAYVESEVSIPYKIEKVVVYESQSDHWEILDPTPSDNISMQEIVESYRDILSSRQIYNCVPTACVFTTNKGRHLIVGYFFYKGEKSPLRAGEFSFYTYPQN